MPKRKDYYTTSENYEHHSNKKWIKIHDAIFNELLGAVIEEVLDVGSGSGVFATRLKAYGYVVNCIEMNEAHIQELKKKKLIHFEQDIEEEWADNIPLNYDAVILCEVLEHLFDPRHVLEQSYIHLRPGGKVIITIPNFLSLESRLKYLMGKESPEYNYLGSFEHIRILTAYELRQVLEKIGFERIRIRSLLGVEVGLLGNKLICTGYKGGLL